MIFEETYEIAICGVLKILYYVYMNIGCPCSCKIYCNL